MDCKTDETRAGFEHDEIKSDFEPVSDPIAPPTEHVNADSEHSLRYPVAIVRAVLKALSLVPRLRD